MDSYLDKERKVIQRKRHYDMEEMKIIKGNKSQKINAYKRKR